MYTLIDDDIKTTRLPVTCLKFFNPPNHTNQDHLKIVIASCKYLKTLILKKIEFFNQYFNEDVSGYIKFWHYPSKSCIYTIVDNDTQPLTIDFNRNFDSLAVGGYNERIKIFDVATKKLVNVLENR